MMNTYLIDSNILIYAINEDCKFHKQSRKLIEQIDEGKIKACVAIQNLLETFAVITDGRKVEKPLSPNIAMKIIKNNYIDNPKINKILPTPNVIFTFLSYFEKYKIKSQEVFDLFLVATMIDNGINGIYTKDIEHFRKYEFLKLKDIESI